MGIAKGALELLAQARRDNPHLGRRLLQLGRQHTFVTQEQLVSALKKYLLPIPEMVLELNSDEVVNDVLLFSALGFSTIESLDVSGFEDPTYLHDLNNPIPPELAEMYDVVLDGGTIEHIFDVRAVMTNIHNLLAVGGSVIHLAPSSNHVDHGFYMFSPTLFFDYYSANNYLLQQMLLFEYTSRHDVDQWLIRQYVPGSIDHLSFGGWGGPRMLGIYVCATKTPESTSGVIPQQGMYRKRWAAHLEDSSYPPAVVQPNHLEVGAGIGPLRAVARILGFGSLLRFARGFVRRQKKRVRRYAKSVRKLAYSRGWIKQSRPPIIARL